MNRRALNVITLPAVAILALAAHHAYFLWAMSGSQDFAPGGETRAGLEWLKSEFELSDEAAEIVAQRTAAFSPRCEAMCRDLAAARGELAAIIAAPGTEASAIEAAYANVIDIEQQCFRMTLRHIYEVGAVMRPGQQSRYRSRMVTRLLGLRSGHHRLHEQPHASHHEHEMAPTP